MIKLQFKLPQALISRGFTRRTVFHAPAVQIYNSSLSLMFLIIKCDILYFLQFWTTLQDTFIIYSGVISLLFYNCWKINLSMDCEKKVEMDFYCHCLS